MDFKFLQSERFWQLFFVGLVGGLTFAFPDNKWAMALSVMVSLWFGGSVAVRTIDRFGEKTGG